MSKSMAGIGMETKLSGSDTLPNAAPTQDKIRSNSKKPQFNCPERMDSGKDKPKNVKRGKLLKALTLPAEASAPSTSEDCEPVQELGPRKIKILPRTSQYEKHPLLQEKSASGLSELEQFLLDKEKNAPPKSFPPKESKPEDSSSSYSSSYSRPVNKLKLEPRGAHCERHALLKKTPSGMSELELFLREKNKECEKKEKKLKKKLKESKSVGSAEIPPHKRLWIKKGISVEKAKSFERTACLEKTKSMDQASNVSRAKSLEEEETLKGDRLSALTKEKTGSVNSNPTTMDPGANDMNMDENPNDLTIQVPIDSDTNKSVENTNSNDENTLTGSVQENNSTCKEGARKKLLDLALSPSLEWKEVNQQFVVTVQSPVSPLEEKPDNLLICIEHREGGNTDYPVSTAPQEKPKKFVHPTVIDSDPDSEGMVCMDELEPIDFGMSSPEPSPAKTQNENQLETEPLINTEPEAIKAEKESAQESIQRVVPVDVEAIQERRRQLSIKRASLGQLEPRVDQYEQHILLQKRDEEGKSQIDRLLEQKNREKEEQEKLLRVDSNEVPNEPNMDKDGCMKPKASIKRVHFEKSGAGSEIEMLGKVDIEADPVSNTSEKSGNKKRGSKNKSNKSKEGEPEEEKLLNGDSDDREKDQNPDEVKENKCCCIS